MVVPTRKKLMFFFRFRARLILWMIFFVKISDMPCMHESMNFIVFCELAFGIGNVHCHKLLQSFLQMILSRGDNSTDLCYTLNTYRWLNMGTDAETIGIVPHAPATDISNPKILPEKPWNVRLPVCSVGISCMYHHNIGKVPKPLMQVVVAVSWELLGYAGSVAWS